MSYKMSKAAALLCCGAMALCLAACGGEEGSAQSTQNVSEKIASDELFTDRDLSGTYDESEAVAIHLADGASTCEGNGVEIQEDTITITKEGVYVLSGTLTDGQVIVDAGEDKVQLVLQNAKIACEESAAVYVKSADKVFLTLADNSDNTLESSGEFVAIDENDIDATVFSKDDLTLNGTGSLRVTCESGHGIVSKDDLKLTGGTYEISCVQDALSGNDSVRIADGEITIDAGDDGIHSDADLIIVGGTITINDSYEGLEGQTITIDGGNITLSASDDGLNAAGGNDQSGFGGMGGDQFAADSDCYIEINGGTLHVDAVGDGLDSNGNLTITGGEIYVAGPSDNGNGALDYAGTATISGGIVVATGASGMAQNFGEESTQGAILVSAQTMTDGEVVLLDEDGEELIRFSPGKSYNSAVISCPEITDGKSYTILLGEESQTIQMDGMVYGAGGEAMGGFGGGMRGGDKDKQQMMQDGDTFKKGGFGSRDDSAWNGMEPPQKLT